MIFNWILATNLYHTISGCLRDYCGIPNGHFEVSHDCERNRRTGNISISHPSNSEHLMVTFRALCKISDESRICGGRNHLANGLAYEMELNRLGQVFLNKPSLRYFSRLEKARSTFIRSDKSMRTYLQWTTTGPADGISACLCKISSRKLTRLWGRFGKDLSGQAV